MNLSPPSDTPQNPSLSIWQSIRADRTPVLALILLTLALYIPVIGFEFVNWDDPWYVTNNSLIKSWTPSNLGQIATKEVARNYAPLTIFSFLIDHTLWGDVPVGYHLTNLLGHVVASVLVYLLITRLSASRWIGWTTAAFFALHPVQIETVAWVSSRKGILSAVFMLWSLWYYLKPERSGKDEVRGLALLVAALLSKAIAVVIPPIVLCYDVLIRRRKLSESVARQMFPAFFSVMLILITMRAQTSIVGGVRGHLGMNKFEILLLDTYLLWKYVGMLLWPANLAVLYDPPVTSITGQIALSILAWTLVATLAFTFRKRQPLLLLALISWFALFFPVMNLFPITTLVNDRYLYLPIIPVVAVFAAGLRALGLKLIRGTESATVTRYLPGAALATTLAFLSIASMNRLPVWTSPYTLWRDTVQKTPTLAVVHIQWADTLHDMGQTNLARAALIYALNHCHPDLPDEQRIHQRLADWRTIPPRQANLSGERR